MGLIAQKYEKKINAHTGLVLTLDYHHEGRYIASGGRDRMFENIVFNITFRIKIWDLDSDTRHPFKSIQTIASVARVQWR